MRLWTFRDPEEWKRAEKLGHLRADGRRVMERAWRPAYRWMMRQMQKRIPGYGGRYPIWAWADRSQADLRKTGNVPVGCRAVLVTCEVPDERVLISDFDAWHFALNGWYLPKTDAEYEEWRRRWPRGSDSSADARRELERSWEVMFDPKALDEIEGMDGDRVRQAVLEEIRIPDEVIAVRELLPRVRRRKRAYSSASGESSP